MKVYKIKTCHVDQTHCVVADSMGEAERIFKAKYWPVTIIDIELLSEYVQIQTHDEQPKEVKK